MEQVLLLFFHVITSALVALLGRNRKIGYAWSFVFCLVLSVFIGVIIILFSKKNDEVDVAEIAKDVQQN
jgi:ABC-type multidrug transport system permease subunit